MAYTYAEKKRAGKIAPNTEERTGPGPSLDALRSGAAAPTAEQMGRRVDLPDAMREKMESAFGADLSAVKLYESEAVGEAGANAVTQGANVAFAPGMLDFTSYGGQALLGHEISHVVSQARGEVTGGGFLNDRSLEARADREGALAAAGEQVSMPSASLSPVSASAAAGPMQADKKDEKIAKHQAREAEAYDKMVQLDINDKDYSKNLEKEQKKINRAKYWQKYWAGDDYKEGANPELTGSKQLSRAKARNTREDGSLDEAAYFANAGNILGHMDDDQLNSIGESGFREQLVDEYSAYRGRQLAAGGGGDAFQPDDISTGGMLANLYTRMMGVGNIQASLSGKDNDANMAKIADLADSSGVTELLSRQQVGAYGLNSDPEQQQATMRSFWNYSVMSPIGLSAHARQNAAAAMQTLNSTPGTDLEADPANSLAAALAGETDEDREVEPATSAAFQNHLGASGRLESKKYEPYQRLDLSQIGKANLNHSVVDFTGDKPTWNRKSPIRPERAGFADRMRERFEGDEYEKGSYGGNVGNNGDVNMQGLSLIRMVTELQGSLGDGYSEEDLERLYTNLMAPHRKDLNKDDPEAVAAANAQFDSGMRQLKDIQYSKLKRMEATYGRLGSQLHPEDFARLVGEDFNDHFHYIQDSAQMLDDGSKYFDFERNEKDREFKRLHEYFFSVANTTHAVGLMQDDERKRSRNSRTPKTTPAMLDRYFSRDDPTRLESEINGPSLTPEQQEAYTKDLRKRADAGNWSNWLFGRFKKPEGKE